MIYALYGLVLGLLIPHISRRFAKFMPATLGYGIYQIFKTGKRVKSEKWKQSLAYNKLRREFIYRSLFSGLVMAALAFLAYTQLGSIHIGWYIWYIWALLLLAEIDYRMLLLPDILTIPLLITGFATAAMGWGLIDGQESAIGAVAGYFLPVIVSLLFVWKNKDAFGGGDIKLLAALGSWLGVEALLYVIVVSSLLFLAYAGVRQKRSGAYGPAIAVAGIIVALYFF